MEIGDWAVLLTAATAAGWVDAVVGGGGLIVLPTLFVVAPGIAPQTALGTNKLAAVAGTSASVLTFARKVPMRWRVLLPAAAIAAGGGGGGGGGGGARGGGRRGGRGEPGRRRRGIGSPRRASTGRP
ncbi:TSUP family transporter, partial [Nocardia abscessus]|uniref:TSUP family transporter n=1 Tax=Nocardia abscessus TaxID=120957 RepID=UPI002457141B